MNKNKVLIIAEAGVNHNGNIDQAFQLIDIASESGADVIKFQTFNAETLVSHKAQKADYQINNGNCEEKSQFQMLKKLEIPKSWYEKLIQHCENRNIQFLSTGFDEKSNDFLEHLGIPFFKIPSGEITNKPYLEHIAKKGKNVVLSTGMSTLGEVKQAIDILNLNGLVKTMISVLHCNTEYPTPFEDVNLNAMTTMKNELQITVGYSDHTLGISIPIAAVAMGARIIEKHFTLDKSSDGPDHKASLEPEELYLMVKGIRNIEKAIGNYEKKPSFSEKKNIHIVRKSIHLKNQLNKGHLITKNDLIMLRPGDGISPMKIELILGKKINKDLQSLHKLNFNDLG